MLFVLYMQDQLLLRLSRGYVNNTPYIASSQIHTFSEPVLQVLLSNDETLQIAGVQCVADILGHHPQYGQTLLQADIAG